ncbi:MAG: NnrU family protein [Rhizobium sp.]
MALLIAGIILFLGTHMIRVVAPDFRSAMIAKFGESGWKGLYAAVSLLTLAILIYGYAKAPVVDLYFPPAGMAHLTLTLMLLAMIFLVAGMLPAGHIATKSKHPMVLSIKIWAFSHLLANGDLASVLLFGSFLAWGVLIRIALKRRQRAGELVLRPFVSARNDILAVVIGAAVWLAFIWKLHELLIGVPPIVM